MEYLVVVCLTFLINTNSAHDFELKKIEMEINKNSLNIVYIREQQKKIEKEIELNRINLIRDTKGWDKVDTEYYLKLS